MAEWEAYFDSIPADSRYRLDHEIEIEVCDRLARDIDWKRVASLLPGIDKRGIAMVEVDESSLDRQRQVTNCICP